MNTWKRAQNLKKFHKLKKYVYSFWKSSDEQLNSSIHLEVLRGSKIFPGPLSIYRD